MKKVFLFLLALALILAGCASPSDVLDDRVDQMAADYSENAKLTPEMQDALDTLDLMLEQYVSGLKKPSEAIFPRPSWILTATSCSRMSRLPAPPRQT